MLSAPANPAPSCVISCQIFTWSEIKTGSPKDSASTTLKPKFSWCDGSESASAVANAPFLSRPARIPVNVTRSETAVKGLNQYGYPPGVLVPLGVVVLVSVALYVFPRTAVLGAILLTGWLGGAVNTHVRAGEPWFFAVIFGILVWLALYLRDARVRALVPLR